MTGDEHTSFTVGGCTSRECSLTHSFRKRVVSTQPLPNLESEKNWFQALAFEWVNLLYPLRHDGKDRVAAGRAEQQGPR